MKIKPDGTGYLMSAENPNDPSRFFMLNANQAKRCDEETARLVVDLWEHNVAVDTHGAQRKNLDAKIENWESRDEDLNARIEQASKKYWTPKSWTLWAEDGLRAERDALNLEAVSLVERDEELDRQAERLNEQRDQLNHRHQLLGSPPRPETRPEWAYAMLPSTQPLYDYPVQPDEYAAPPVPNYAAYMNQPQQHQTPLPQQHAAPQRSGGGHGDAFEDLL